VTSDVPCPRTDRCPTGALFCCGDGGYTDCYGSPGECQTATNGYTPTSVAISCVSPSECSTGYVCCGDFTSVDKLACPASGFLKKGMCVLSNTCTSAQTQFCDTVKPTCVLGSCRPIDIRVGGDAGVFKAAACL
jgi:hypothetical protein